MYIVNIGAATWMRCTVFTLKCGLMNISELSVEYIIVTFKLDLKTAFLSLRHRQAILTETRCRFMKAWRVNGEIIV